MGHNNEPGNRVLIQVRIEDAERRCNFTKLMGDEVSLRKHLSRLALKMLIWLIGQYRIELWTNTTRKDILPTNDEALLEVNL